MRILVFLLSFSLICFYPSFAQQIKTDVLVYGNGPGAVAAAIQSARSGVKTILVFDKISWAGQNSLAIHPALSYGIWAEFAKNYSIKTENKEQGPPFFKIDGEKGEAILKSMIDTVKRLTLIQSVKINSIKASGKGWEFKLADGKKVISKILLDATREHLALQMLQVASPTGESISTQANNELFRTSVAAIDTFKILPISALIPKKTEYVVALPKLLEDEIVKVHAGQAAGAIAAFCAFFNTSTKKLDVRTIQSELLTFRSSLFPLADILPGDSSFIKIQHQAVSGIMNKGFIYQADGIYFQTKGTLSTEELKSPMKSFYSRSQIWFDDHRSEKLSIREGIDLLMYTATRGEELRREIERGWKTNLGLSSAYEASRPINRKEFAILLDTYLHPFSVKVNLEGHLLN